jgi:peptidoglycan/LPS O-acetylase OafA/YrhL
MKQITDLTCCRALFAAWVFAYHVNLQADYAPTLGAVGTLVRHGSMGVDGFFILSGMILAYAHPDLSPKLSEAWRFWVKRLVRIYPVHIAMILLFCILLGSAWLMHLHPRDPSRFSGAELARHIVLIHAWGASDRWAWNYPSWSISAEWAGYLLFPFLWMLLRRQNGIGLALVLPLTFLGVVFARILAHAQNLSLTYDGGLIRFFPEFIAGIAILPLLSCWRTQVNGNAVALCGTAGAVAGTLYGSEVATVVALWFMLAGLLLAARQGRAALLGRLPALRWLGEISYSYYMSFAAVETMQATLWRHYDIMPAQHPLLYGLTTTAMTLGLAVLAWRFVERPAMRAFAVATARTRYIAPASPSGVITRAGSD